MPCLRERRKIDIMIWTARPFSFSLSLSFLFLLWFSLSFSSFVRARTNGRGGLQIDSSCNQFAKNISHVIGGIQEEARLAVAAVDDPTSRAFLAYFRPQDKPRVRLVFQNIVRFLGGYGCTHRVNCKEDNLCLTGFASYIEIDSGNNWQDDQLNLCEHILNGSDPQRKIVTDFCAEGIRGFSVAEYLLHEMLHLYDIANSTRISDYAYHVRDCQIIGAGRMYDQYGNVLNPTYNANNYVLFAWNAAIEAYIERPYLCNPGSSSELRKLQGFHENTTNGCIMTNKITTTVNLTNQAENHTSSKPSAPESNERRHPLIKGNLKDPYEPDVYTCSGGFSPGKGYIVAHVPPGSSDIVELP